MDVGHPSEFIGTGLQGFRRLSAVRGQLQLGLGADKFGRPLFACGQQEIVSLLFSPYARSDPIHVAQQYRIPVTELLVACNSLQHRRITRPFLQQRVELITDDHKGFTLRLQGLQLLQ